MKLHIFPLLTLVLAVSLLTACAATPTAAPTVKVEPSALPTAVATPSPFPTIQVEDYAPRSFCDHPYFPLRVGTEWALSTMDVVMTLQVKNLASSKDEAAAELTRKYDFGEQYDEAWRCTSEGIYGYAITAYNNTSGLVQPVALIQHTGYFLPAVSLLKTGYTWDELTITLNQGYTVTTDLHYTVASMNPVSVLNQQVPGIQIKVTGKMTAVDKSGKQTARDVDYLREFGLGVGLVREDELVLRKLSVVQ